MTLGQTHVPPYGQSADEFHYGDERAMEREAFRSDCKELHKLLDKLCFGPGHAGVVIELQNASCEPDSSGANVELGFRLPRVSNNGTVRDRLPKLLRELADKVEGRT